MIVVKCIVTVLIVVALGAYAYFDWKFTKGICDAMKHDRDIF